MRTPSFLSVLSILSTLLAAASLSGCKGAPNLPELEGAKTDGGPTGSDPGPVPGEESLFDGPEGSQPNASEPVIAEGAEDDEPGAEENPDETPEDTEAPDPCTVLACPEDQSCLPFGNTATCVPNDCETLTCTAQEFCEETQAGALCLSRCTGDLACSEAQYCDTESGRCLADECIAGNERCEAGLVLKCSPNGGEETEKFACQSPAPGYESQCHEPEDMAATCGCRDDWDCPEHTVCEVNQCVGSGQKPSCRLKALPMEDVLPVQEISWGGTLEDTQAAGSPFPESSQVVLTPIVANLDDDTGDGLIDERDFPEIIFATFCGNDFTSNGILRAIHGGGPNKGKDYFASCAQGAVWHEGEPVDAVSCDCDEATLDSTASLAVGDLDYDGIPEIVGIHESDGIMIYNNRGELLSHTDTDSLGGGNPAPSLANLDHAGPAEIIVGRNVFTLTTDVDGNLTVLDHFMGDAHLGRNGQGPASCVADVLGDDRQEVIAGATVYRFPAPPAGATARSDCTGSETDPDAQAWCYGTLVVEWSVDDDGFCAIADVLGEDPGAAPGPLNPLDGTPEVVVVSSGKLRIYNAQTGTRHLEVDVDSRGGAPNIDDFDGDGFPEIGTAFGAGYFVFDLQSESALCPAWPSAENTQQTDARTPPPASCEVTSDCGDPSQFACNPDAKECVCLHNGWTRTTQDGSSRVTGSSVFDFNGDGAAEVIYNDECFFRLYRGIDGHVFFAQPSESRTRIEYPIVADVDNDGNAEIVFSTTNESNFCDRFGGGTEHRDEHNNGLETWGDAADLWVSARRVWNQHAYHVTNITEGAHIPLVEAPSWQKYNGRQYNTYRSNPRSFGVAPDLTLQAIQVSSPDAQCGQLSSLLDITVQVANVGDLRVGPGVVLAFIGDWEDPDLTEALRVEPEGAPLSAVLGQSLEPGDVMYVTVSYDAASNPRGTLPSQVTALVDSGSQERECDELNNSLTAEVSAGTELSDLAIIVSIPQSNQCPTPTAQTQVTNLGSLTASNYVVRYYAGNPSAGGSTITEVTRPGPLEPGATDTFDATLTSFPESRKVLVFADVDPDNVIAECNDGNNRDSAEHTLECGQVIK